MNHNSQDKQKLLKLLLQKKGIGVKTNTIFTDKLLNQKFS